MGNYGFIIFRTNDQSAKLNPSLNPPDGIRPPSRTRSICGRRSLKSSTAVGFKVDPLRFAEVCANGTPSREQIATTIEESGTRTPTEATSGLKLSGRRDERLKTSVTGPGRSRRASSGDIVISAIEGMESEKIWKCIFTESFLWKLIIFRFHDVFALYSVDKKKEKLGEFENL